MKRGHRDDERVSSLPLRTLLRTERPVSMCCQGHHGDGVNFTGRRGVASDLSERFGVSEKQAWRWLGNIDRSATVSVYVADAICTLFHVPLEYVYAGSLTDE